MDLTDCEPVNFLWSELSDRLGLEKACQAVRQAIDLQVMNGDEKTLPILFIETCGVALTTFNTLRNQTGISLYGSNKVLIFSKTKKSFQVLYELK
ncbi:hypothetical protein EV06_1421 [Prochlorococcus sp. MIT 0602]|nr:hypothetical protein EV06_1421 [Prochlorococcus sp. MIT 0602]KGG17827.1 hypothetical protein EV07_1269 [Prochlorococcus sp. MIT 0603]